MQPALKPMAPRQSYALLGEAFSGQTKVAPAAKDAPLEAIRGVAAISVVLWHSMLAFFPEKSGSFRQFPDSASIAGEPWFGLVHGTAAVTLFFVLSGFVLTRRYFETYDGGIVLRGVLKRWPRLAGPVVVVAFASYALFVFHAYSYGEAAEMTKSPWLSHFGNLSETPFAPSFVGVANEGMFATFFRGDSHYDSSLWTMRYEFGGSFIAFGAALTLGLFRGVSKFAAAGAIGALLIFLNLNAPAYVLFVVGVGLAYFLPRRGAEGRMSALAASGAVVLAVYLFGFSGKSIGAYALFPTSFGGAETNLHALASVLLISAVEHGPGQLRRALSGPISAFLGALSFPVYLVHVLVLCSAGSAALLWANSVGCDEQSARGLAVAVTLVLSTLAALPLIAFNERWVGAVNRIVAKMVAASQA